MTIDEAIKHCLEVAERQEISADDKKMYSEMLGEDYKGFEEGCQECAADHRQLAEWLTEYKELEAKHWNECRQIAHYDNELSKYQKEVPKIVEYIDYLRSLPVNRWISVGDKLPENNKLVLCYARSTTGEGNSYFLGAIVHGEFWFLKVNDIGHVSCPVLHWEVTHWQPLPEPPKDGDME